MHLAVCAFHAQGSQLFVLVPEPASINSGKEVGVMGKGNTSGSVKTGNYEEIRDWRIAKRYLDEWYYSINGQQFAEVHRLEEIREILSHSPDAIVYILNQAMVSDIDAKWIRFRLRQGRAPASQSRPTPSENDWFSSMSGEEKALIKIVAVVSLVSLSVALVPSLYVVGVVLGCLIVLLGAVGLFLCKSDGEWSNLKDPSMISLAVVTGVGAIVYVLSMSHMEERDSSFGGTASRESGGSYRSSTSSGSSSSNNSGRWEHDDYINASESKKRAYTDQKARGLQDGGFNISGDELKRGLDAFYAD